MGDFNAHNIVWNCRDIDINGENLQEKFFNQGLICVNQDTLSRINSRKQVGSNSDLIFAGKTIDHIDYEQLEDAWESDHYPLRVSIDTNILEYKKISNRLSTKKNGLDNLSQDY